MKSALPLDGLFFALTIYANVATVDLSNTGSRNTVQSSHAGAKHILHDPLFRKRPNERPHFVQFFASFTLPLPVKKKREKRHSSNH